MSYVALYRKWRPKTFDDVIGQEHIIKTIKNEINNSKISHAYLFCGGRGTGKTSTAKLLSKAVNCLAPIDGNPCNECDICIGINNESILDVVEIDAASNNGVDNIRLIRDEVAYLASSCKYKVYIIDEVHMLSGGAFNALLKTLEEPPEHVIFVLATTELNKIPATILSRCERFDFKRISSSEMTARLLNILKEEEITADSDTLSLVARLADGSMRDSLGLIDKCISSCGSNIAYNDAVLALGVPSDNRLKNLVECVIHNESGRMIKYIDESVKGGLDIITVTDSLVSFLMDIFIAVSIPDPKEVLDYSEVEINSLKELGGRLTKAKITNGIESLSKAITDAKRGTNSRIICELAMLKLCDGKLDASVNSLLDRIEKLENIIKSGAFSFPPESDGGLNIKVDKEEAEKKEEKKEEGVMAEENEEVPVLEVKSEAAEENPSETTPKVVFEEMPEEADTSKDSTDVLLLWKDILDDVKKNGNMLLYSLLLPAEPEIRKNEVKILYARDKEETKNTVAKSIDIIKKSIENIAGKEMSVSVDVKGENAIKKDPLDNLMNNLNMF